MNALRYSSERFPFIELQLSIRGLVFDVEALLDTGFDGFVAVPMSALPEGWAPDLQQTWTLANGSEIDASVFIGEIRVGDLRPFMGLVAVIGSSPLVGRGVSDRFLVTLDRGRRLSLAE